MKTILEDFLAGMRLYGMVIVKSAPQVDDNKGDVAQAIRYKEWLQNHHYVTRERGINVLTKDNSHNIINQEVDRESLCSFSDE